MVSKTKVSNETKSKTKFEKMPAGLIVIDTLRNIPRADCIDCYRHLGRGSLNKNFLKEIPTEKV